MWGSPGDGGIQPSNLDVVSSISSSYRAFAALTEHGTVVAWGNPRYGGGMTDVTIDGVVYTGVPAGLKDVRALYSNRCFCCLDGGRYGAGLGRLKLRRQTNVFF